VLKKASRLMIYGAMMPAQAAWGRARHGLALPWFNAATASETSRTSRKFAAQRQDAKLRDLQQWGDVN
jgi:hypothetical protein